jgi:hypothetical protein
MIYKTFNQRRLNKLGCAIKPGNLKATIKECKGMGIESLTLVSWPEESSLEFLKLGQSFLKGIHISLDGRIDISPINSLTNLEYFESNNNRLLGKIDFSNFPQLKYLNFGYSDYVFTGFESLTNLVDLNVNNWPYSDLHRMNHLSQLGILEFQFAKKLKSLNGIKALENLYELHFYSAQQLEDISALEGVAKNIKKITFELTSRIKDFSVLEKMPNLEKLYLFRCAPIPSIQFLKKLKNLKYAYIGTEVLDGDVAYLEEKGIEYKKLKKYKEGK